MKGKGYLLRIPLISLGGGLPLYILSNIGNRLVINFSSEVREVGMALMLLNIVISLIGLGMIFLGGYLFCRTLTTGQCVQSALIMCGYNLLCGLVSLPYWFLISEGMLSYNDISRWSIVFSLIGIPTMMYSFSPISWLLQFMEIGSLILIRLVSLMTVVLPLLFVPFAKGERAPQGWEVR